MAQNKNSEKRNLTVFGTETEFDGILEFTDNIIITGKFTGKINAPEGDLQVARNAVLKVENIDVNSLTIAGNITGNVKAKDRVEICNGSKVEGDVTTARIRIANNVEFNGQITMLEEEPEVDLFSVASSEYKKAMLVKQETIK